MELLWLICHLFMHIYSYIVIVLLIIIIAYRKFSFYYSALVHTIFQKQVV